ncbi:hypothetical protein BDR26DRAFT_864750 [Obelidium mucronatum]|nr:hypothetical protein BDR26DRAFT_864750 [Obelidium mucronatum]
MNNLAAAVILFFAFYSSLVLSAPTQTSFDLIGFTCGKAAPRHSKSWNDGCLDSFSGKPSQTNPTNNLRFDSPSAGAGCGGDKAEQRFGRYFGRDQNIHFQMDEKMEFRIIVGHDFQDASSTCVFLYEAQ